MTTPASRVETLELSREAVLIIDDRGGVVFFNRQAESLWGCSRDVVLGKPLERLLPCLAWPDWVEAETSYREIDIVARDGRHRHGELSMSRLSPEAGGGHALFVRDITEERACREELRLLSLGVNETGSAVVTTGADNRIIYVNEGFTRMMGYSRAEVMGRTPSEFLLGRHSDPNVVSYIKAQVQAQQHFQVEVLIYDKEARPLWISAVINPVFDDAGQLQNLVAIYTDITHTKMHQRLQQKVLGALAKESPLPEVATLICREIEHIAPDVVATILRVDAEERLYPLAAPSLPVQVSQRIGGVAIGPQVGACGAAAYWGEQVVTVDIASDPNWQGFRELFLPLGLVACWSNPIKASDGRVIGTLAFYYREKREPNSFLNRLAAVCEQLCALALERDEARVHIRQLAYYDGLTGLPNRRRLYAEAEQAIAQAQSLDLPLAVLFVDLDRFKQVNDSLGHGVGDELLREMAQRIQSRVQAGDLVGRLSGDEFVVVSTDCNGIRAAELAEQLLAALAVPVLIGGTKLSPSASIGISLLSDSGGTIAQLLQHADMAMYQAKMAGRHRYCFFSAEMNRQVQDRQVLESALREALEYQQLRLHYQPQLRLGDGSLFGVEALARWRHPLLGVVPPDSFIPLAEECGLIQALSRWALDTACGQLAAWRRGGLAVPNVSVNLSAKNFRDAGFAELVAAVLARHGLQPADLTLELTERVLIDEVPETQASIRALHRLGVRLSIDDFGTGYSSLGYLHRLPVDELKLDKRFVGDLANDAAARALTQAIVRIGESLQLTVVAEGVEDEAQRQLLLLAGCPVAQGYLFARPMEAEDLEGWLAARG